MMYLDADEGYWSQARHLRSLRCASLICPVTPVRIGLEQAGVTEQVSVDSKSDAPVTSYNISACVNTQLQTL